MFTVCNIDDLYYADIEVTYPMSEINFGGMGTTNDYVGYTYQTVVKKNGNKYIDLKNPSAIITEEKNKNGISCTINNVEPVSEYYDEGDRKKIFIWKKKIDAMVGQYRLEKYNKEQAHKLGFCDK